MAANEGRGCRLHGGNIGSGSQKRGNAAGDERHGFSGAVARDPTSAWQEVRAKRNCPSPQPDGFLPLTGSVGLASRPAQGERCSQDLPVLLPRRVFGPRHREMPANRS
jgi:hypothetical protein